MIPSKTIEELILKHSTLEKDLSTGEIDKKLFAEKSKEYSDVNEIIENAKNYLSYENDKKNKYFINGIENRVEQIVANLLENAISFSDDNKNVTVKIAKTDEDKVIINVLDQGEGFKEKDTSKIFRRFYSNRPDKFGEHSGLGLNIVKNLVELHNASIKATNRKDQKGASMEIIFPKV